MRSVERNCMRVVRATASFPLSTAVVECRPWASALFVGHRLTIVVQADDDSRLDAWLMELAETELTWRRYFVASADIVERSARAARVELLVVEA